MKNSQKLSKYLYKIESIIPKFEEENLKVSKSTVGWHIDHSLKVINNVIKALQSSEPTSYKNNFSWFGKFFFALGFFPRGKAKAPKHVKPPETILLNDLMVQAEQAKSNIKALKNLEKNAFFKHPLFGNINTKRVHRFLVLHTNHHLKIIRDILSK